MSFRGRRFQPEVRGRSTFMSFGSESSREPSREPTPVVTFETKPKKKTWVTRFLASSILVVFVFAFAIVSSFYCLTSLRKNYCLSKDEGGGCMTCPENGVCTKTRFKCVEGYRKRFKYCVIPDSDEDVALNCLREVNDVLHKRVFRTVRELSSEVHCPLLELAVNLTDEFQVNNGEIQVVDDLTMQRRKQQFMTVLPFFFWLLLLYLLYARQ